MTLLAAASPQNGVSLEVPSLLWSGVELDGERFVHPNVSLLLAAGARFAGRADFSTVTLSAGTGARLWLNRFRFFTELGGPMIAARLDAAWARTTARTSGTHVEGGAATLSARLGYRCVLFRRVELTPEAGVALSFGFDPAMVPRPGAIFGLTLGYLF
jgi:hypothetical protein